MGEGLAKPPQIKPCWVAPPHLPQGGTMLIFLLPGQGHVMTDSGRVPLKQIYVFGGPGGGGVGGGRDYVQDHTQCMFSNLQEINTLELEPTKKVR